MAVQYAPMKLRVPPGFQNLLEGLAREVLREQPEDIINFAAQYFRNQLLIRDETGKDDAKKGDQMERLQKGEEVDIDPNDPGVQAAATKIQASFRGHKAREDVKKHKDEEAAAVKIQAGFRGHKDRERVKEIKVSQSKEEVSESVKAAEEPDNVQEALDAKPAMPGDLEVAEEPEKQEITGEDQVTDAQPSDSVAAEAEAVTQESEAEKEEPAEEDEQPDSAIIAESAEAADAVDKEQTEEAQAEEAVTEGTAGESTEAAEKGDAAEEPGEVAADVQADGAVGREVEGEEEQIDIDMNDPEVHSAVVKIQASFRGHKAREEVKSMKSSESSPQGEEQVVSEEKSDDEKQEETEGDEKQEVAEGDEDKGNDDAEPSVTENADDSKPSED